MIDNREWDMPRVGRYLKVGERITIGNKPYRVEMVNNCRARCVPTGRKRVSFTHPISGKVYNFKARDGRTVNIAPITERK